MMLQSTIIDSWRLHTQHLSSHYILYSRNAPSQLSSTSLQITGSSLSSAPILQSTSDVEVLSTQDIIIGAMIAFLLAFSYSYLNGQSSSTNFVSWRSSGPDLNYYNTTPGQLVDDNAAISGNTTVLNETNWKEMSRPENYILYNTRIRDKQRERDSSTSQGSLSNKSSSRENKLIVVALLALFLPIFSIEIFFALSRQFICEGGLFGSLGGDLAEKMCSPIFER
ncbi:hypothetical protein ACHAXN_001423 [Cyclotella atomus]